MDCTETGLRSNKIASVKSTKKNLFQKIHVSIHSTINPNNTTNGKLRIDAVEKDLRAKKRAELGL